MLIRHSLLYMLAKFVPGLIGLATTAVLTRLLEPGQFGLYGLALVVMTLGSTVAFDWLGIAYLRFAGRAGAAGTFVAIFLALVAATLLLAIIAFGGGFVAPAEATVFAAGLVMMWAYAWFELVSRFHMAELRPLRYLRMNLGRAVFIFVGAVGGAWLTQSPVWAAFGSAAGMVAGACVGAGGFRLSTFDRELARSALTFGLPLAASLALASLAASGSRALLAWLGSVEALGLYTAGFVLVQNTLAVAAAGVASAGYTLAVRALDAGDPAAARRQLLANGALLIAVLAPMAVGMALAAPGIAAALVGPHYVAEVTALTPWMAAGGFFAGVRAHFLDHAFQLGRQPRSQIAVTATAGLVTTAAGFWLIPTLGALGAAMAATAGMVASCVHAVIAGRSAVALPMPWATAGRIAASCAVMALSLRLIPGADLVSLAAQVVVGATVYASAAIALDVLGARATLGRRFGQPVAPAQ